MKTSQKSILKNEILAACNNISGGSPYYRLRLKSTALSLIEDLSKIGMRPIRLKNLKTESVIKLVAYWRQKKLKSETIKNRLVVIRSLAKSGNILAKIPCNSDLNIIIKYRNKILSKPINILPTEIDIPQIKNIVLLQYFFGLKKQEALKFESTLIRDNFITVPRKISYNKKERTIPIITAEQNLFLNEFISQSEKQKLPIRILAALHHAALSDKKINEKEYFRYLYILNRFQTLNTKVQDYETLKIIATETGYSDYRQIKEILGYSL